MLWLTEDEDWDGVREYSRSDLRGSAEDACGCWPVANVFAADAGGGGAVSSARRIQVWEKERIGWRMLSRTRTVFETQDASRRLVGRLIVAVWGYGLTALN